MTLEDYAELFVAQGEVCAICKKPETQMSNGKVQSLCVDHDHVTGKVRGLLCNACNVGLSRFRDNAESLRTAAIYLEDAIGRAA